MPAKNKEKDFFINEINPSKEAGITVHGQSLIRSRQQLLYSSQAKSLPGAIQHVPAF